MRLESISATGKRLLAFAFVLGLVAFTILGAQAQTFSVIYNFTNGSDGGGPLAGLTIDSAGNLYGTASTGGSSGAGVVFQLNTQGQEKVLYSFTGGADGATPEASLIIDAKGNLYGTTFAGGTNGAGVVFKLNEHGKETVLYTFSGGSDGANPEARLAIDAAGNLYGTTTAGGAYGTGVVFKLSKQGKEEVLFSFYNGPDGWIPIAGVTLDAKGRLYGTTSQGGTEGYGTVFQLKRHKSGWTETILHNFKMEKDGGVPYAGLVFDAAGNLYGAATDGGGPDYNQGGTVFELTPSGNRWKFTVLDTLAGWGISGTYRDLLLDASGNVWATTHCDGADSAGTVYELTPSGGAWTYTQLYSFTGGTDGQYAFSNLVFDQAGNLYGTTNQGGAYGYGDVFKVTP